MGRWYFLLENLRLAAKFHTGGFRFDRKTDK